MSRQLKKWEIACQIRYGLGLNDRAEDILVKLTETDLTTLAEMISRTDGKAKEESKWVL